VTTLMFPAFAELEGAGAADRQRRLLLAGLRGGTVLMLVLALPFLFIPDLLIHAWIGGGFHGSYLVMALLAGVALVHQPIYVLTQFLIARGLQRPVAIASIVTTLANLALSFALAWTVGIWGVALSTLVTDFLLLVWLVPRIAAPAAGASSTVLVRAMLRPLLPALVPAVLVFGALSRWLEPRTLLTLAPIGVLWAVAAGLAGWRLGFTAEERLRLRDQIRPSRRSAQTVELA